MPKVESSETPKGRTTKGGWSEVLEKKKYNDEVKNQEFIPNFFLGDGESATIQFMEQEPYCFDAHQARNAKGKWRTVACQLAKQKYCLLCDDKIKLTWKAAFAVLDYRGTWDKDKKKFVGGKPVEKIWECSNSLALQIKGLIKPGKLLTDGVFEVSRSGSGAQDTSYNFSPAFDEEAETRLKPIKFKRTLPSTEECCLPPTDAELERMGLTD